MMTDPISPDEERLLAAIRDAPADDDQPRLVYADWLLDRGDPRGELISTQCALSRTADGDPGRGALERRAEELLAQHRERWCGGIEGLAGCYFERGFVLGASVSASTLARRADQWWRLSPSRLLRLSCGGGADAELAACPALARYRALIFHNSAEVGAMLVQLARSPYLAELESLGLGDCSFDDGALAALARSPHLTRLRSLDLRDPGSPRRKSFGTHLRALAEAPFAPRLEELWLRDSDLPEQLVGMLAAFQSLAALDLGGSGLGSGLARLAALPLRLRRLGLARTQIDAEGVRALAGSALLGTVETLDVSSNPLGEDGARALARSLPRLETLTLSSAGIGPKGVSALARADLPHLRRLTLDRNGTGDAGAIAFAISTTPPALRSLDLSDNSLTDDGAIALAVSPHLASLESLRLRGTPLGKRTVDALRARFGSRVGVDDPA